MVKVEGNLKVQSSTVDSHSYKITGLANLPTGRNVVIKKTAKQRNTKQK